MASLRTNAFSIFLALLLPVLLPQTLVAQNDIEDVRVEVYYISDANDATDAIGGGLVEGSRTYRIFIDLASGRKLRALYGRTGHPLRFESTAVIFNHLDRGRAYGHTINNGALDEGVAALDSWLSLGGASTQKAGIRKGLDPDGSIVGGANNDGGSAAIAGGLLVNAISEIGIPLVDSDGLVPHPNGVSPPNFLQTGDDPSLVFGDVTQANGFNSTDVRIGCSTPGVVGPTSANELLVAQITTTGDLSFELNIEVVNENGVLLRYVALNDDLGPNETANGLLRYPQQCGCTDPGFLEYDPAAGCDDGSCSTVIIFGCLDTLACNFDASANFNINALCCYGPGNCNGLDVDLLCPGVGIVEAESEPPFVITLDPLLGLGVRSTEPYRAEYVLHDLAGRVLRQGRMTTGREPTWITMWPHPHAIHILTIASTSEVYRYKVAIP